MMKKIEQALLLIVWGVLLGISTTGLKQKDNIAYVSNLGVMESDSYLETVNDYIDDEIVVPSLGDESTEIAESTVTAGSTEVNSIKTASGLPGKYDSRDYGYITEAKEQENNTCWAYSAASIAETSLLKKGIVTDIDLSENQLAYYFYHTVNDALGNTYGDTTTPLPEGANYLEVGGNHIYTTFALADWIGMTDEVSAADTDWNVEQLGEYAVNDTVHLQNAYWINLAADQNNVKRMIQQYGSVGISMKYLASYYNEVTYAYYNNVYTSVNHAVTVVGWDDNYSKTNFSNTPSSDGAWLVKNSYGTEFGDNGFFWISYEDAALTRASAKAFVFDFEMADNYDYNYQYDGTAGAYMDAATDDTGYSVASGESIANVFKVPESTETGYQTLEAVSFALYAVSVDYSIQIYKDLTDVTNPTSGTAMLETPKTGKTSFVGYYTVPLEESVMLAAGENFSVVVTLAKSNNSNINYFVDKTYENGGWISFVNTVAAGQSFAYTFGSWQDLNASGATARIKAFTDNYILLPTAITLNQSEIDLQVGDSQTLTATITPENATYQNIDWSTSDESVAEVDEEGMVTAIGEGTASIIAINVESGITATCTIIVEAASEEDIEDIVETEDITETEDIANTENIADNIDTNIAETAQTKISETTSVKQQMPKTEDTNPILEWVIILVLAFVIMISIKIKDLHKK